jgi:hypothetical protein
VKGNGTIVAAGKNKSNRICKFPSRQNTGFDDANTLFEIGYFG